MILPRIMALGLGMCFLLLAGCADERPVIVETPRTNAPEHVPAGNAIEAMKAYGFEQRDLAVNNLQGVTSDLDRRIRDFRARSKTIASDSRDDWNDTLTELEKKRDELEVAVTRLKYATHDTWGDVKGSTVDILEDVQSHMEKLQEIVRD